MAAPHRIEIPEHFGLAAGAHVLIRPKQSWAAKNRVQTAGLVVHTVLGEQQKEDEEKSVTIDTVARGLAVLESAVMSWTGVLDADDKPLPPSRQGFMHEDFDPDLGDWLVDCIDTLYAAQSRTEQSSKPASPTLSGQ